MSDEPVTPEIVEPRTEMVVHATESPEASLWRHFRKVGLSLAATGFVPEPYKNKPDEIMACLAYGHELGLGPMQSLQSLDVIQGKPTLKPEMMRSLIRAQGHTLQRTEATNERVTFYGKRRDTGDEETVTFTIEDAASMGLLSKSNWTKMPRAMLTARATAEIARSLFSDVIMGASYTPDELGDDEPDYVPYEEPRQPAVRIVTNDARHAGHAVRTDATGAGTQPKEWGWHTVQVDGEPLVAVCNRCGHPVLSHSITRRGCFQCACNYAIDAVTETMKTVGAANPTPSVGEREPAGQPVNDGPESVEGSLPSPTPATVTPPTSDGGLVPGQTDVQPAGSTSHPPAGPTADLAPPPAPPNVFRGVHAALRDVGVDDDGRHAIVAFVTGHRTESSKDLTSDEAGVVLSLLGQLRVRRVAIDRQFGVVALDPKGQEFLDAINPRNAEPLFVDTADVGTIGDGSAICGGMADE